MKLLKKAAMFGLDARIALAIFGALSVISGAALYSAIRKAKAIALVTEMREVGKAWEQYLLDTGQNIPKHDNNSSNVNFYVLKIANLVNNISSIDGWNGPYLNYSLIGDSSLSYNGTINIMLHTLNSDNWGGGE